MVFHEIYSLYYRTVADILACAVKNELTEEKLLELSMADELAETAKIMNNTENATL